MTPEDFQLGRLDALVGKHGGEQTSLAFAVSRLAADNNSSLYLLEVVGPTQSIAGLRACLNTNDIHAKLTLEDVRVSNGNKSADAVNLMLVGEGYSCHMTHLGHGHHHALFISRAPGFLKTTDDEALYAELKKPHCTTPLLRPWMPFVAQQLRKEGLLKRLYCFNCECAFITATTADLDRIVSDGVKDESLEFRESA